MIIGLKIWGVNYISDEMTLGAMVYISVLIGIYTTEKIKTNGKTDSKSKK
jgi:hypothetical protein